MTTDDVTITIAQLRATLRLARAEAWDEGFDAGWSAQDPDDHAPNPYEGVAP